MAETQEQKFNDDLLFSDEDRKRAARSFPGLTYVLDFPKLRETFGRYDVVANRAKRSLRHAGLATIVFGVIALLGASTEPLFGDHQPAFFPALPDALNIISATAAVVSILTSTFGVFGSASKVKWLEARLMTERLRQFQFQTIVFHIPNILAASESERSKNQFKNARDGWFATFEMEYTDHLPAKLKEVLEDDPEEQFALYDGEQAAEIPIGKEAVFNELMSAYRLLRIKHQIQYTTYKLGGEGLDFPRRQVSLLTGISLICILLVFLAHFVVSISYVSELLPFAAVKDGLTVIHRNPVLHVLIIWIVIVALAARAFEEGLQPTREVERYTAYKARLGRLYYHFDHAADLAERVRVMTEVERLVYQEMRGFLKTNYEARFVL